MNLSLIASGFTWFQLIPGYNDLEHSLGEQLPTSFMDGDPIHLTHLAMASLMTVVVLILASMTKASWASSDPIVPEGGITVRNLIETIIDAVLGIGEQVLGSRENARRFLPLIGTLAMFIFFSNILGLIPGFAPPTDTLNFTVAPAVVVFLFTHYVGIKAQGSHYFAHFLGPKLGGVYWLAPLMLPIELISHIARPVSLSIRLMGNMFGDHQVLAIFVGLTAFSVLFPLPILALGTIVCIVQTLVFCLLSMVYIALAIEHSEEGAH